MKTIISDAYDRSMLQKFRIEIAEMMKRKGEQSPYVLIRHSGRRNSGWKIVARKANFQEGINAYSLLSSNLRQGTVVLWDVMDEEPVHFMSAPKVRG